MRSTRIFFVFSIIILIIGCSGTNSTDDQNFTNNEVNFTIHNIENRDYRFIGESPIPAKIFEWTVNPGGIEAITWRRTYENPVTTDVIMFRIMPGEYELQLRIWQDFSEGVLVGEITHTIIVPDIPEENIEPNQEKEFKYRPTVVRVFV